MKEKKSVTKETAARYHQATKGEKHLILEEFTPEIRHQSFR
jgi:hypothetical protein